MKILKAGVDRIVAEFQQAMCGQSINRSCAGRQTGSANRGHSPSVWLPPPEGTFKLNVDAVVNTEGNISAGAVIRNSGGEVVAVGAPKWKAK